jgi:hypothetical protein
MSKEQDTVINISNDTDTKKNFEILKYQFKINLPIIISLLLYTTIHIILVTVQVLSYIDDKNIAIIIARVSGILISFNISLILLLIMKRSFTRLRRIKWVNAGLPIDHFLSMHKFIGVFILALSLVHTCAHLVNICKWFLFFGYVDCFQSDFFIFLI